MQLGMEIAPVTPAHLRQEESLPLVDRHNDPNDRLIIAQAISDKATLGSSVDLAELGNLKVTVPSRMMDTPEEVTVAKALKTPKITFTPKADMLAAAKSVKLSIDHSAGVTAASSSTADKDTEPGAETGGDSHDG